MKSLFIFMLGIALGGYGMYTYKQNESKPKEMFNEQLKNLHITPEEVRADLIKTGEVVREKASNAGVGISDARILAVIKAKYILDHDLASSDIQVEVDHGDVTLSGHVASSILISKAISLALDTDGVRHMKAQLLLK
jgi:hypothetical protein